MNSRAILAIVRKDLRVALQNKGVVLPIVILPLILFVVFPWIMAYAPTWAEASGSAVSNVDELLARMPAGRIAASTPPSPALTSFEGVTGSPGRRGVRATAPTRSATALGRALRCM